MTPRWGLAFVGLALGACKPRPTVGPVNSDPPRCQADRSWVQVSVGAEQACGVHGDGCIECWGGAWLDGEMEDYDTGSWVDYGADEPPEGVYTHVAVAKTWDGPGLWHACALDAEGRVNCWGRNDRGQCVPPAGAFMTLSLSGDFSCGLGSAGEVVCWGEGIEAEIVPRGFEFVDIAASPGGEVCALDRDGGVSCGGYLGHYGTMGAGIGAMDFFSYVCAVGPGLPLACWDPTTGEDYTPELDLSLVELVDVCLALDGGCVLDVDGHVECWEMDGVPAPDLAFTQISCGEYHVCGVTRDGGMECWGGCDDDTCDVPP